MWLFSFLWPFKRKAVPQMAKAAVDKAEQTRHLFEWRKDDFIRVYRRYPGMKPDELRTELERIDREYAEERLRNKDD